MKALTLWQPWASFMVLVPDPPKKNETRGWDTNHRGPLAIHAAASEPGWVRKTFCSSPELVQLLDLLGPTVLPDFVKGHTFPEDIFRALPRGAVLGSVEVIGTVPTDYATTSWPERALGDYSEGRFAWVTRNPVRLLEPVPWKGRQGFWNLPDHVLEGAA